MNKLSKHILFDWLHIILSCIGIGALTIQAGRVSRNTLCHCFEHDYGQWVAFVLGVLAIPVLIFVNRSNWKNSIALKYIVLIIVMIMYVVLFFSILELGKNIVPVGFLPQQ